MEFFKRQGEHGWIILAIISQKGETTVKTCITKLSIGQAALANPTLK